MVTPSCSKSSVFKMCSVHTKTRSYWTPQFLTIKFDKGQGAQMTNPFREFCLSYNERLKSIFIYSNNKPKRTVI